jgi:endoglucanase
VLFDDMFVDLGVDSEAAVKDLGVEIGTPAVFGSPIAFQGENIVGPSMDNRVAGTLQVALARGMGDAGNKPNLTLISTVQEEIGMKGAAAAAARCKDFDWIVNIDVGLTGDIPGTAKDHIDTTLGKGPIIVYKDFSIHYSSELITRLEGIATKHDIPVQKAVFKNYRTDGMSFFMAGVPTCTIAIPCRYTHTNFETVRACDLMNALALLTALLVP